MRLVQKCVNMTCFGKTLNIPFKTKTNNFGVGIFFSFYLKEYFMLTKAAFYLIKIQKRKKKCLPLLQFSVSHDPTKKLRIKKCLLLLMNVNAFCECFFEDFLIC